MKHIRNLSATVLLLALALPMPGAAQATSEADASRLHATRDQLQAMLARFEQGARMQGYSDRIRQVARDEADLIRQRLEQGDMQVGDQIELNVTGMPALSGTFTVTEGRVLLLPEIGAIELAGFLRSELPNGIREHLAGFIVDPQVIVRSMVRLSVWGAVGTPGYIVVPSDNLLTDVLASAGQPTATARQDEMQIKRGDDVIWDGEALQTAIIEGRTIDQLNLRAGDKIEVPEQQAGRGLLGTLLSSLYYVVPLGLALIQLF
jgi:protein involved in polysaccharide export with SLBB domain